MEKIETNVVKPEIKVLESGKEMILLDNESEKILDSKIETIVKYISENSGKGKTDKEKDELYLQAQRLWKEFIDSLKEVKYNFHLNRNQHKFLTDLVLNKLEYDVNSVFFAIELRELFDVLKENKYKNDVDFVSYPVNATEITYIYHLISKHKVRGLTKDSYLFAEVLMKIGNISKVFNYYDATGKNLSTDIQDWVLTFEEGVTRESRKSEETVQGEVL
jgi:hypothetical protein